MGLRQNFSLGLWEFVPSFAPLKWSPCGASSRKCGQSQWWEGWGGILGMTPSVKWMFKPILGLTTPRQPCPSHVPCSLLLQIESSEKSKDLSLFPLSLPACQHHISYPLLWHGVHETPLSLADLPDMGSSDRLVSHPRPRALRWPPVFI